MRSDAWREAAETGERLVQGYLCLDPERVVRVRRGEGRGALTVKGLARGATRAEFEYAIPPEDAAELLALCVPPLLEKTRWRVRHAGHLWEIDEFAGESAGLVVAEVELASESEKVPLPPWVGEEVTADPRYANASLVTRPFRSWGPRDGREAPGRSGAGKGEDAPDPADR